MVYFGVCIAFNDQLQNKTHHNMKVIANLKEHINWFPGHMARTLRKIEQNTHKIDIFIQIRDARNPLLQSSLKKSQKQKIIVFNKYDLCDPVKTDKIIQDYNNYGIPCFAISTKKHDDMRKMVAYLKDNFREKYKQVGLWAMICGMPNVGKSSIINQLRSVSDLEHKRATAKATASVCTTRGIRGFKILNNPLMFLMDSPGVMIPSVIPKELGMKMSVLGLIKEQIVDKQIMVNYLVQHCQHDKNDKYWKNLRLERPSDATDYMDLLRTKHKLYNYDAVYDRILSNFREGNFGKITLDQPIDIS